MQACTECDTHRGESMIHLEYVDRAQSVQTVPVVCMHCEQPTCAEVCPADAIKRTGDGVVQSARKPRCIACGNCVIACPFGVPEVYDDRQIMMKCDMCYDRSSVGKKPMCATVCPSQALFFGTREQIEQLRPRVGADQPARRRLRPSPFVLLRRGLRLADRVGGGDHRGGALSMLVAARMNQRQGLAAPHLGAHRQQPRKPDGMVHGISRPRPAAAQRHHSQPDVARCDAGHKAVPVGLHRPFERHCGQMTPASLDEVGGPAERLHHAPEGLGSASAVQRLARPVEPGRPAIRRSRPTCSISAASASVTSASRAVAPRAGEELDRVRHLHRIAGRGGERLVHVGDQRRRRQPGAVGDLDQARRPAPWRRGSSP